MLRLYIDEDAMDKDLARALRARRVDVLTARDAGLIERDDVEHLDAKRAAAQRRVLYGFNVGDYHRLHTAFLTEGRSHAGIILARQQHYSVGEQMRRILKLFAARSAEEM